VLQDSQILMTQIYVKVKPGADSFNIKEEQIPVIKLEETPKNGRANHELLNRLEELLGVKPAILSGHKSRRKKLKIPLPENEIRQNMRDHNG